MTLRNITRVRQFIKALAAFMAALVLCVSVFAQTYIHGYFRYTVDNQSVTITAYTGREAEVTVPNMIGGNPVNTIAAGAFSSNDNVTTINLPDTIMTVDNMPDYLV